MIDSIQTTPLIWHSSLKPNDIVAFRFPHERPGTEAPKVRPTLVLDVYDVNGTPHCLLAYGTASNRQRAQGMLVPVCDTGEVRAASLRSPTQFDGVRRIEVAVSDDGFSVHPKLDTPVIGRLTGASAARSDAVRKIIKGAPRPNWLGGRKTTMSSRCQQTPQSTNAAAAVQGSYNV